MEELDGHFGVYDRCEVRFVDGTATSDQAQRIADWCNAHPEREWPRWAASNGKRTPLTTKVRWQVSRPDFYITVYVEGPATREDADALVATMIEVARAGATGQGEEPA